MREIFTPALWIFDLQFAICDWKIRDHPGDAENTTILQIDNRTSQFSVLSGQVPMSMFIPIIAATVCCIWPALFLLAWRDGRRKQIARPHCVVHLPVINQPPPSGKPFVWDWRALLFGAFTISVMVFVLIIIWPGFIGAWLGTRRRS
jgi:hypothetical protein